MNGGMRGVMGMRGAGKYPHLVIFTNGQTIQRPIN